MMDKQSCVIPAAFVPLNYQNDPETEDLIFGGQLAEGMVVLAEGPMARVDPDDYERVDPSQRHRILETARWCRVVSVQLHHDQVTFIAEYSDATKASRSKHASFTWYVKKASMPD